MELNGLLLLLWLVVTMAHRQILSHSEVIKMGFLPSLQVFKFCLSHVSLETAQIWVCVCCDEGNQSSAHMASALYEGRPCSLRTLATRRRTDFPNVAGSLPGALVSSIKTAFF